MSFFQNPAFLWGIAIVAGVALAIVVLTEIIDRLKRANSPFAPIVQIVRNVVLVLVAVFFVQRMVMGLTYLSLPVRVVATAMWLFAIIVIFRLSNAVFQERDEATWHHNIPRLVKRLPALIFAAAVFAYVLQNVWSLPLGEYVAALGLGSIAIAFALQDTISNLVSGLFIIFNRPFSEGEWIHIGEMEGRVLTVTWRYTRIETRNGDLVVVPNGSIAQGSITNHSEPQKRTRIVQPIVVAYVNPPNKVKQMLMATMLETPGILSEPQPVVAVTTIDDPLMGYEVRYWIDDYADKPAIHNAFMTRIWYAARRFDVALPSPAFDLYHYDGPTIKRDAEVTPAKITEMLETVATFAMLPEGEVETSGPFGPTPGVCPIGTHNDGGGGGRRHLCHHPRACAYHGCGRKRRLATGGRDRSRRGIWRGRLVRPCRQRGDGDRGRGCRTRSNRLCGHHSSHQSLSPVCGGGQ